jgi:hypothetical protein
MTGTIFAHQTLIGTKFSMLTASLDSGAIGLLATTHLTRAVSSLLKLHRNTKEAVI